jgi:UDP-N-acetylglucosamine 2-epimerase (non-hydrolysing)
MLSSDVPRPDPAPSPGALNGASPMLCMVVGARPNFMKMAPVIREAAVRGLGQCFVHTGQHYDAAMSGVFFEELGMPRPDIHLGVGSGSHAEQTARVMMAFEPICLERRPDLVVVSGDVNSTLACALTASKLAIPVAHIEAGLRSFDRTMPEEINRTLTDHVSDLLFTSEPSGRVHLLHEGVPAERIHFVGNAMIDSLRTHLAAAIARAPWRTLGVEPGEYALVTLHRPAVVDHPERLDEFREALCEIGRALPVIFPVHPRTRSRMDGTRQAWAPVRLIDPLGYLDFLGLMAHARLVLTDSGGIQEETTALSVPCVTLRDNTERPITVEVGTNRLAGTSRDRILSAARDALTGNGTGRVPDLWEGRTAGRIVDVIQAWAAARS